MKAPAVVVPLAEGEATRRRLVEAGLLRRDLAIARTEREVAFPVSEETSARLPELPVSVREFAERPEAGPARYADLVPVPDADRARLPRAFDIVGDIVLLRLGDEWKAQEPAIGAALLAFVPGARLVAVDEGVRGRSRVRALRPIAGSGSFRTVHRENGLAFEVDLAAAYFSPRLGREHLRVAEGATAGESVLDLCCGVGPFGLTLLARAGAREATFLDANPAALGLARATAERLGVAGRARFREEALGTDWVAPAVFDRVVLNLPHEGNKYLAQVGTAVAGGGVLHYYEIMERAELPKRLDAVRAALPEPSNWSLEEHHTVHPYAPTSDLVGLTLRRRGA